MHETEKPSAPQKHLGYLDGLRALAALFVVAHHIIYHARLDAASSSLGLKLTVRLLEFGHYPVDLFIVLSGFCLMLPVVRGNGHLRQSNLEFFRRRAWRILPTYYCAMLLSLLLAWSILARQSGTIWDISLPVTAKSVLTHLCLVQDVFGEDHTINYAFWSIAVEWRIYFLFPALVWCWQRYGPVSTTTAALGVSFVLYHLCVVFLHASLSSHYLGLFVLGMLGASISFAPGHEREKRLPWGWISAAAAAAVILSSKLNLYHGGLLPEYLRDYLVGAFSTSLLILASTDARHPVYRVLNCKPLVTIGVFSYSIYLVHAPLLQMLWLVLSPLFSTVWLFVVLLMAGIPAIVGVSYLFYLVCERPLLQRKIRVPASMVAKTALEPAP